MHRTVRALLSAATAALSATVVLVGLPAGPAHAMNYDSLPLQAWAYTDEASPATPNANPSGNYLIGSSTDAAGVEHTGRGHFTFDLAPLRGQVLHRVTLSTSERSVVDCSRVAPIEVWRTEPVTAATTWAQPPRELELLDERSYGKGVTCPGAYLGVELIPAVQAALDRGETTLSLSVRIKAGSEQDVRVGRTMSRANISYAANHAPTVSGLKLKYPAAGCGTLDEHPSAGHFMQVQATGTDADPNDYARVTYAYWPVDRPDLRKESSYGELDLSGLADGTVVAWTAQARDYDDAGPWGETCYFAVDLTAPATTPIVTSADYPGTQYPGTGGQGVPGVFRFDAGGDLDVVAFDWSPMDGTMAQTVKADHPGGTAEVTHAPRLRGGNRIQVRAVDAAANRGAFTEYRFEVRDTAPRIEVDVKGVGLTSRITLTSPATEATEFGYTVDGGPEKRVPAVDRKGEDDLVFDSVGTKRIVSRAYAGTKLIGSDSREVPVSDEPGISSAEFSWLTSPIAGTPGSFTFTPRTTRVVAYRYRFGSGDEQTVDAGPDGSAVLPWTPDKGGRYRITVTSVDADGAVSRPAEEQISVIDTHPTVSVDTWRLRVGEPVTVTANSELPDAVAIVYSFDGGPQQTLDGAFVWFDVVPTRAGDSTLTVWAKRADGTLSPPATTVLHIDSSPAVASKGPFGEDAVAGRPVALTFTAVQAGATTFRYTIGIDPDAPEQTVAAGPGGTATITYDVPADTWGNVSVEVTSLTADGTASDTATVAVPVRDPRLTVYNPWEAGWGEPAGGPGIAGQFGFSGWDLGEVTTKFMWRIDDGPVQEAPYDPWAWETLVAWTPERSGEHTLHVQREFTDGSLSPLQSIPLTVGTQQPDTSGRAASTKN